MPNNVFKTPLLVPIPSTFDEYLASISKRSRYEHKKAAQIDFAEVGFDKTQVEYWMRLWEKQPIAGGYPKWRRYTPDRFEKLYDDGFLHVFHGRHGLQMVEQSDRYVYAHPPLYDKQFSVAKAMWFSLIRWCCGRVDWLDLGGGGGNARWDEIERKGYKWLYVPKNIKREPWRVQICACGWRQLVESPQTCRGCRRKL